MFKKNHVLSKSMKTEGAQIICVNMLFDTYKYGKITSLNVFLKYSWKHIQNVFKIQSIEYVFRKYGKPLNIFYLELEKFIFWIFNKI